MFEKARDAAPVDRTFAMDGIGAQLLARRQFEQAEEVFRRSFSIRQETHARPGILAWSQAHLGRLLCERGRAEEGARLAETALKVRREELAPRHQLIAVAALASGSCMVAQKRFDAAEALLNEAYTTTVSGLGVAHRDAREAAATLVRLFQSSGNTEKAMAWRAKAN